MRNEINAAIIGASGYTGLELFRLLHSHEKINDIKLFAFSQAGRRISEVFPSVPQNVAEQYGSIFSKLTPDSIREQLSSVDVVFLALPHNKSQEIVGSIFEESSRKIVCIDLGADFRINDPAEYQIWYQQRHQNPDLLKASCYGLSEVHRQKIQNSNLIGNPGCFPTAILLALIPLAKSQLIDTSSIIIDAKTGMSGAGKKLEDYTLFNHQHHNVAAYGLGGHRHSFEIDNQLSRFSQQSVKPTFTPHLIPTTRGIYSTSYVKLGKNITIDDIKNELSQFHSDSIFVNVLEQGTAELSSVVYSNNSIISVHADRQAGSAIIISAIDNLIKGASGQAVQNMNIRFGFDEATGLSRIAVYP